VKNNTLLRDFHNIPLAFRTDAFMAKISPFYRPLQTVSFMVDAHVAKEFYTAYHLSNVLLLGVIALLLYLFLLRFSIHPRLALLATLLFCTHPLFVSTVAWIPARGDLLVTVFSLASCLLFIEYLDTRRLLVLLIHLLTFFLALLCKETAAVLPIIFIAYYLAFTSIKRFDAKQVLIIVVYAIAGIVWFLMRWQALGDYSRATSIVGLAAIKANLAIIPTSLAKFFIPFNLALIPCFSTITTIVGTGILTIVLVLFITSKERSTKQKLFCLAWFALFLVPPMLYKHALIDYLDHRFLLPLIGILLFTLFLIPKKWTDHAAIKKPWFSIAVIVCVGSMSFVNARSYANQTLFYDDAISQNTSSVLAYNNRGLIRCDANINAGAIDDFTKALALDSTYEAAYNNRGIIEEMQGNAQAAIGDYNRAIALNPQYAEAYYNRGKAKVNLNDDVGAIADYNKAIALNPNYTEAWNNRGNIKLRLHDYDGAIADYTKIIATNATVAAIFNNRGIAKANKTDTLGALADYTKAIALQPDYAEAYNNRGNIRLHAGNYGGAIDDYTKAIAANAQYTQAYFNKGIALALMGTMKDAEACFTQVIAIDPHYVGAYVQRALCRYNNKDYAGAIADCDVVLHANMSNERVQNIKQLALQELQKKR
jgi:tetratricopeptide (TPR) repeat protein